MSYFFNESLLKSHSTVTLFMYRDAFNWLMSSWKFDSINFKRQTSLKGGLETQAVLFEAVPCTIRQVTKRMHSVNVTKGISFLKDASCYIHWQLDSWLHMKDSQVCLQKGSFPNKDAKDKDRDAKHQISTYSCGMNL